MIKTYEQPYVQVISHFCKHGFKNQVSKLKVIDCKPVLTLGFGIKPSGRLPELQQCVEEQLAKRRKDNVFWKSISDVGKSKETSLPALTTTPVMVGPDGSAVVDGGGSKGELQR